MAKKRKEWLFSVPITKYGKYDAPRVPKKVGYRVDRKVGYGKTRVRIWVSKGGYNYLKNKKYAKNLNQTRRG